MPNVVSWVKWLLVVTDYLKEQTLDQVQGKKDESVKQDALG